MHFWEKGKRLRRKEEITKNAAKKTYLKQKKTIFTPCLMSLTALTAVPSVSNHQTISRRITLTNY